MNDKQEGRSVGYVNLITSDKGWILERLAKEIRSRLPYVLLGESADDNAGINYYMTYSTWRRPSATIDIAFFTHHEPEPAVSDKFFEVANAVDHCVTMSKMYETLLREKGITEITTISPGVDTTRFFPSVKIGVVGRTYHTGRKGEHLVADVMDEPNIEWHFTGSGWPLPGKHVADEALPDFYRDMDYILISSLYEGGPMCALEALACGTAVIAPDVGWMSELPHIPFKLGDRSDLRRVLSKLVSKKISLQQNVVDRTWDKWAEKHDRLFKSLLRDQSSVDAFETQRLRPQTIGLVLHGSETSSPGGPSVRVPRLAKELQNKNSDCAAAYASNINYGAQDIVHCFNVWNPNSGLETIRYIKARKLPLVFSPIYLDLSLRHIWEEEVPKIIDSGKDAREIDRQLERLQSNGRDGSRGSSPLREPQPGFFSAVREMLALSDHTIFLSHFERQQLESIGAVARRGSLVRNPVDAELWANASPQLFYDAYGISDYVLCVGRIEPRKNQLMLLHALRDTNIPIVLIGHKPNTGYHERLVRYAGAHVTILDRLESNSPMLASAVAGARVFVLPSWAEGAPLAALEAGAAGTPLVLSSASGEREYFEDRALYCDPGSPSSIRLAVLSALEAGRQRSASDDLKAHVAKSFNWPNHVREMQSIYADVFSQSPRRRSPSSTIVEKPGRESDKREGAIVFDVTTSAGRQGRWTGISRVEMALALALVDIEADIYFVAWNNEIRKFVSVPSNMLDPDLLGPYLASCNNTDFSNFNFPKASTYVIPGSAWMQSEIYPAAAVSFANYHKLPICIMVYDLIPVKFPFWFESGYSSTFVKNLTTVLENVATVVCTSESTKCDIEEYMQKYRMQPLPIASIRLGDTINFFPKAPNRGRASEKLEYLLDKSGYILSVGAVHARKNQAMLCDLWVDLSASLRSRCPKLVIAGGVGWGEHGVSRRIVEDKRLANLIVLLDDVDDDDLDWLYKHCLFTVYPSLYEGWGLPVAESLRYGKVCLASSASSVPEIAPNLTDLIDPRDYPAWLSKLRFYISSREARSNREDAIKNQYVARDWSATARDFVSHIQESDSRPRRPYLLGTAVDFAQFSAVSNFGGSGWLLPERWGTWSGAQSPSLAFAFSTPFRGPLLFAAHVKSLATPEDPMTCDVIYNNSVIASWRMTNPDTCFRTALLKHVDMKGGDTLNLVLVNRSQRRPVDIKQESKDRRLLGVGLSTVALLDVAAVIDKAKWTRLTNPKDDLVELDTFYDFFGNKGARRYLRGLWAEHPAWGLHSQQSNACLEIIPVDRPTDNLEVSLEIRPVTSKQKPVSISVTVNGELVASVSYDSDEVQVLSFEVSTELRYKVQPLSIKVFGRAVGSPADLALGAYGLTFLAGILGFKVSVAGRVTTAPAFTCGQIMSFSAASQQAGSVRAVPYLQSGWNPPEANATWTRGRSAVLAFDVDGITTEPHLLIAHVSGFDGHSGPTVEFNDVPLSRVAQRILPSTQHAFFVPRFDEGDRRISVVRIAVPETVSPFAKSGAPDERRLGARLWSLKLQGIVRLDAGGRLDLSSTEANDALLSGWFQREDTGRWTGQNAAVVLQLDRGQHDEGRLVFSVWSHDATPDLPLDVEVFCNQQLVATWRLLDSLINEVRVEMVESCFKFGDMIFLELHLSRATPPASEGGKIDKRKLGLFVRDICYEASEDSE